MLENMLENVLKGVLFFVGIFIGVLSIDFYGGDGDSQKIKPANPGFVAWENVFPPRS